MADRPLQDQLARTLGTAYTIERELGGGGMSRVYVAEETRLKRKVVVKVLSPELAAGVSAERFEREIQLAAALQQANIVPVLSTGDTDGLPYYTMPFVDGLSLRDRLSRNGAMPVAEVISVLRDVARALGYAHEHGIVHRDIKPENILLSGDAAVVTDFGIAKALSASRTKAPEGTLTQVGTSIGTPAYMAPEQAAGDPNVDHRADLYALGCVAYEMLSGAPPFHDRLVHQIFAAHMTEAPAPIAGKRTDVPRALASVVMRCLEKDANRRPQSAREVIASLDSATSGQARSGSKSGRTARIAAAAVVVVAGAMAVMAWRGHWFSGGSPDRSVAVLPFAAGSDSAQTYFAEGVADELTTALSRIPGLRVASRSAAFSTARHTTSAQDAGRALHVGAVLEGSVRRSGSRLRITAQLTNVADGFSIWSDAFDRDTGDVFTAQDELSRRIADLLRNKLALNTVTTVAANRGTNDQEAYDLFLRGRYAWQRRGAASLEKAADLFTQAIHRDPNFARAWAGLGLVQVVLPEYLSIRSDTLIPAGKRSGERAIKLDSTLSDGYVALGYGLLNSWQLDSSDASFRRALALSPDDPAVHQWYGDLLEARGQMPQAVEQLLLARRLDPNTPILATEVAFAYLLQHRYADATAMTQTAIELDPTLPHPYFSATLAYSYLQKHDTAIALMKKALVLEHSSFFPDASMTLAVAYALAGRTPEARKATAELDSAATHGTLESSYPAAGYAALGDRENTIRWLTRSVNAHEASLLINSFVCYPVFDFVRTDPRYFALVTRERIGPCVLK